MTTADARRLAPYDFEDRGTRVCATSRCRTIVLAPKIFCRQCWKQIRRDLQDRLVRAVIDRDQEAIRTAIDAASRWIVGVDGTGA